MRSDRRLCSLLAFLACAALLLVPFAATLSLVIYERAVEVETSERSTRGEEPTLAVAPQAALRRARPSARGPSTSVGPRVRAAARSTLGSRRPAPSVAWVRPLRC